MDVDYLLHKLHIRYIKQKYWIQVTENVLKTLKIHFNFHNINLYNNFYWTLALISKHDRLCTSLLKKLYFSSFLSWVWIIFQLKLGYFQHHPHQFTFVSVGNIRDKNALCFSTKKTFFCIFLFFLTFCSFKIHL